MSLGVSCLPDADRYTPRVAARPKPGKWAAEVGRRFRIAMTAVGWSQKRFARETDIAASTVGDLIHARRNVTLGTFEQLCLAAGLDPEKVIAGESYPVHHPSSDEGSAEQLLNHSEERSTMTDKTMLQWDLIRLAGSVQPEDAKAAFDALSEVFARRGLHESGSAETSG